MLHMPVQWAEVLPSRLRFGASVAMVFLIVQRWEGFVYLLRAPYHAQKP